MNKKCTPEPFGSGVIDLQLNVLQRLDILLTAAFLLRHVGHIVAGVDL